MTELVLAPLAYPFVGRALLAVTMVALVCALVGTFAVLRGMSYIGSALAHSLVPGIALGYLLGGADRDRLFWWATATAILASLGMAALVHRARVGEDAVAGWWTPACSRSASPSSPRPTISRWICCTFC